MSANTATIAFRVKPEIKRRADSLFERLGMTTSTGMNILLMQTLDHRGFAAPVALPRKRTTVHERTDEEEANEYPNAETRAVLDRVLAGTEPMYGPFDSTEEMFADIMKD
jgi:addiction module RelB/DinJ family antitoxin